MKKHVLSITILLFASASAIACPDITGNFHCETVTDNEIFLGPVDVEYTYSAGPLNAYVVNVNDFKRLFEVGSWNPEINLLTGEISKTTMITAVCTETSAQLISRFTNPSSGFELTQTNILTPTATGLDIQTQIDGTEIVHLSCTRQ